MRYGNHHVGWGLFFFTLGFYLVEAAVENLFDLWVVKHGFLDLSAGVLVVEGDGFAGSWKDREGSL